MREHGVLNRILLVYDACKIHLINGEQFSLDILNNSAQIIRNFIEDYHEKLEENFLFPRFEKAIVLTDLVQVLRTQHQAGRKLTEQIIQLADIKNFNNTTDTQKLIKLLNDFNIMYRPHEAREDTILFPSIRKIISENEYFTLGEDFENKEHELFGEDGFETIVEKVADLEKKLGIYELSGFTLSLI
jgi:hemerythrin-like domain-containing protein